MQTRDVCVKFELAVKKHGYEKEVNKFNGSEVLGRRHVDALMQYLPKCL